MQEKSSRFWLTSIVLRNIRNLSRYVVVLFKKRSWRALKITTATEINEITLFARSTLAILRVQYSDVCSLRSLAFFKQFERAKKRRSRNNERRSRKKPG